MNLFRYPVPQNRLLITRPHPEISFYTNPASCIAIAGFDPKKKQAVMTHTMNPYMNGGKLYMDCSCTTKDFFAELPAMARVKQEFIEKHSDLIIEYHSCEKAKYVDAAFGFLNHRITGRRLLFHLVGGSMDQGALQKVVPFRGKVCKDFFRIFKWLGRECNPPRYFSINEVNVICSVARICGLGLELGFTDILGKGRRIFDFFPDTGLIVPSSKTRIQDPVVCRAEEPLEWKVRKIMKKWDSNP